MTPRQETIYKWGLDALSTLLCCVSQGLVLQYMKVLGVFPFIYPMLAAVLSTLEGPLSGMIYSPALGVLCDVTISAREETASVCGRELAVSIPWVLPVYFLFRFVRRRCLENQSAHS